ncbi:conjugal transfer protein TraT [Halarcobacter ebronensis]|uniref:Conjugal transfer protein TraT n=1 Tax=Halarcobacter ebronensis TaxID=1462615 RepID=A0A4Q0YD80_9BACT|nr:complement resistance protein TraT [Halarcobacter ebronensis]RXJ67955.1 conjugal transfer protein TraT [Halarcobacter ebronensis]
MFKTKKIVSIVASAAIVGSLLAGCATTELQTQAKMSSSIFLNPVKKSLRIVYVDIRNTSGQELNNIQPLVEQKLKSRGYVLTEDPEQAKYILMANVLFANDKKENNAVGGAVAGAATGAGIGAYNGSGAGGSIAAGIAGGLIGGLIAKATEDTIYQMVVDINVREKTDQKVKTTTGGVKGQAKISDNKRAGFMNSFAGSVKSNEGGGELNNNSVQVSEQSYETNYIENKTTIFAEATKMNLKLEEALPILEEKIATQISGIF